jgi:hypothetical protein
MRIPRIESLVAHDRQDQLNHRLPLTHRINLPTGKLKIEKKRITANYSTKSEE